MIPAKLCLSVVAIILSCLYYHSHIVGNLKSANSELSFKVQHQKNKLRHLTNKNLRLIIDNNHITKTYNKLNSVVLEYGSDINKYRDRLNVAAKKKPKLVENVVNKSFNEFLLNVERATNPDTKPSI